MPMTIGEKILARASGQPTVKPGEIITARIDLCMTNDATTHISIDIFQQELSGRELFDPEKIVFVIDHNFPSESVDTSGVHGKMRRFAHEHGLHFYEGEGICHQLMIEDFVVPGQLVVAADSHTCSYGGLGALGTGVGCTDLVAAIATGEIWLMVPQTLYFDISGRLSNGVFARDLILKIIGDIGANGANYRIMEFGGSAIDSFSIDDRVVLTNMALEAGAKSGLIAPDQLVVDYVESRGRRDMHLFSSDANANYEAVYKYDLENLVPMVARPHLVDNVVPLEAEAGTGIDQGFIGSCNNGRIEELRCAARVLAGRRVDKGVKLLISPASRSVYLQAIDEGLIDTFLDSGAMVLNSNCSVCWGGCQGVIGPGETMVSTGTRNFKGRAGHAESQTFLASAATVAASAVTGVLTDPREMI